MKLNFASEFNYTHFRATSSSAIVDTGLMSFFTRLDRSIRQRANFYRPTHALSLGVTSKLDRSIDDGCLYSNAYAHVIRAFQNMREHVPWDHACRLDCLSTVCPKAKSKWPNRRPTRQLVSAYQHLLSSQQLTCIQTVHFFTKIIRFAKIFSFTDKKGLNRNEPG